MSPREFPLAPLHRAAWLTLLAIPVALAIVALLVPQARELPAPAWLMTPFFVALLVLPLLFALKRRRIVLDGSRLTIAATFYTRHVDVADALDLERARILDLAEHTGLTPMLKLNGFGLPRFRAGHYLLRNRKRAFCLLTRRERVLVLPQRDGKLLLLSPERPRDLLEHLRELATPQPHR